MTDRLTVADLARAYEGLEQPDSFADESAVADYRAAVLERNAGQTAFIARALDADAAVLEVGCGNGRLLVDLARRGHCANGLGIDLAESRIRFARDWAAAQGLHGLRFEAADALTFDWERGAWDAVVCVTSAFAYFEPLGPRTALNLASRMHAALRPGGQLVLELYTHVAWRRMIEAQGGGALRVWHELPGDDPWRFYLSELTLDGDTLTHAKTFIHRHDGRVDSGRREQLELYTPASLGGLLADAGFSDVELFGSWDGAPYEDDELLIATARA